MARLTSTLAVRIALGLIAIHLLLLPVLYYGLVRVVDREIDEQFLVQVRGYARLVADELELGDALERPERTQALLDSAVLRGDGAYAELRTPTGTRRASVGDTRLTPPRHPSLGAPADPQSGAVYWMMLPIEHAGLASELWLGFDEAPLAAQRAVARTWILAALGAYVVLTLLLGALAGRWIAQPLTQLRHWSRRVASGETSAALVQPTDLREVVELGDDLEHMRRELVGVSERLRAEMVAKTAAEADRQRLEAQLRHRHRLETVGTLAGGVAHEFNNALVPITLYSEMLLADGVDAQGRREQLEGILGAARRARDIVRKVLTFSRSIESEALQPVALDDVLDEALKLFELLVPADVRVRREIGRDLPPVLGDARLLGQLVMNLCTNGYQAMHDGGGTLTVAARRDPAGGVELLIQDTGHGMDAVTMERIFEPFFSTRGVGGGTGLGLSVAHGIVTAVGASIHVESAPGCGATFRVVFPPIAVPIPTRTPAPSPAEEASP